MPLGSFETSRPYQVSCHCVDCLRRAPNLDTLCPAITTPNRRVHLSYVFMSTPINGLRCLNTILYRSQFHWDRVLDYM